MLVLLLAALVISMSGGFVRQASAVTSAECQIRYAVCDKACTTTSCRRICKENLRHCLQSAHQGY
jgi:hypothetical protein